MRQLPLRRLLTAAVLGVMVAGCAAEPAPRDAFYRMELPEPEAPLVAAPVWDGVAEVRDVSGDGVTNERPIAYIEGAPDGPVSQYSYHLWTEGPPEAIRRELAEYLRASGLFRTVVTPQYRVPADYEIQGRLSRLEQLVGPDGVTARIELQLGLTRKRGLDLVLLQTYTADVPVGSDSVPDYVAATRRALADIFGRFAQDLEAAGRR
jgi:ABC-type uncharacterized transport system auxiliary subunit